jgi:uncharacterized membrane protein
MSQMPPPPPGQPPPPMGGTPSAAGGNKNLYTILAWALFPPIGSLIFLFVGKDDPDVKYNSANATVIHGAALVIYIVTIILSAVTVGILFFLPILWYFIWFIVWVIGLILALQSGGRRFEFPGIQGLASKYVPMVEGWAK